MILQSDTNALAFLERSAVPNPIQSAALNRPHHAALEFYGQTWTSLDLRDAVRRKAGRLHRAGIAPGQTVALLGPPCPEWVTTLHALGWLGAAVAPLPPRATHDELEAALAATNPSRVLLTHGLDEDLRAAIHALAPNAIFVTELEPGEAPPERFWPLDEVRLVLLTSGSSSRPSAVPLTTAQLLYSAFGSAIRLGHTPRDRWLACLPLHHVGGLSILFRCALYETTVVLHNRFDPTAVAADLDGGRATIVSLVPVQLERVLEAREETPFPDSLRVILVGGDATPPDLLERCRGIQAPIALTWGMTETASQVATRLPGDLREGGGSGPPLPFARVEEKCGRLTVGGPLGHGPVETRDLGRVDDRGRVQIDGREGDVLVSGGETLSLRELEQVLRAHPRIGDAGAIGIPDAEWGERPVAAFVSAPGEPTPTAAELRSWCSQRLSPHKIPDRFEAWASLPRTELGKLRRSVLRERLIAEATASSPRESAPRDRPAPAAAFPVLSTLAAVSRSNGAERLAARLDSAGGWLGDDLTRLEAAIQAFAEAIEADQPAREAARHLLAQPGKRLRPFCTLLAARMGGRGLDDDVRRLAVAGELVHAATLLHDDVIDEGTERRGVAAARVVFGNSASVLGGDYLLAESLRLVSATGKPELLEHQIAVIEEMVDAEALQLQRRGCFEPDREAYLHICRGKTAALFRWVLWGGGVLGGLSPDRAAALGRAGMALGLAYQLVDDALDLSGQPCEIGKDALADLRQGKMTWPFIVAAERDPGLSEALAAAVAADSEPVALELLERVRRTGALEATRAFARSQSELACDELTALPDGWPRQALEAIAQAAVARTC